MRQALALALAVASALSPGLACAQLTLLGSGTGSFGPASFVAGNPTWNGHGNLLRSNGNLTATSQLNSQTALGITQYSSGKKCFQVNLDTTGDWVGVGDWNTVSNSGLGDSTSTAYIVYSADTGRVTFNSSTLATVATSTTSDSIRACYDLGTSSFAVYKNGTLLTTQSASGMTNTNVVPIAILGATNNAITIQNETVGPSGYSSF